MSLIDRIRCGMPFDDEPVLIGINDPLFDPIAQEAQCEQADAKDAEEANASAGGGRGHWSIGIANTGPSTPPPQGAPIRGSQGRLSGSCVILVVRDVVGAICVIGPFSDEDAAFQYVKDNHICDEFWVNVTVMQNP